MSTPKEIKDYIVAQLSSEWSASNAFIERQPDAPDKCLTVYEYSGTPEFFLGGGEPGFERVRVQIRVRDRSYDAARASLIAIRTLLHAVSGNLSGTYYSRIMAAGTPVRLEVDAQDRENLVLNFDIMKGQS